MIQSEHGEVCEADDLAGQTCLGLGHSGGVLACASDCRAYDESGCSGRCGDGVQSGDEECDQTAFGGATCQSEGYYEGVLSCGSDCLLVTTGCVGSCGDGILQDAHGEQCDDMIPEGAACEDLGYSPRSGTLGCALDCRFDASGCVPKSANAEVAMLTVSAGILSPSFSPSTTSYTVEVPLSVLELTVVATAADAPWASVAVSPAQPMTLSEGTNSVTVTVTAEDGTQTSYSLEITRHEMLDYWSPNLGAMMYVPAGTFQRDSTASNLSTVSAFRMSRHEITRAQWVAVTGWADPSYVPYSSGLDDPVQQVSWYDAIAFCNKLSLLEGLTPVYTVSGVNFPTLAYAQIPTTTASAWDTVTVDWNANGYRLPTEMEWMWAAMGSDLSNPGEVNTTGWLGAFSGSTGSNDIGDHVVFGFDSGEPGATTTSRTDPVGSRLGNVLGLVDLSGNIREWVWDWYGSYPAGAVTDYHGMPSGENRGHRGGGWDDYSSWCTVAFRNYYFPFYRGYNFGFRVVRP